MRIDFKPAICSLFGSILLAVALPIRAQSPLLGADKDSVNQVMDSLEVSLFKMMQTYQQVERLLSILPPQSRYWDMLPSVLPVDVPLEQFRITSAFGI